jgi:endonuclease YncB( thermonuclease family)
MIVRGFAVKVFSPLNIDIDVDITIQEYKPLRLCQRKVYKYIEASSEPDGKKLIMGKEIEKEGICYKCRVKGVDKVPTEDKRLLKLASIAIKQFLNNNDNNVICTIHKVDRYNRLVVDIRGYYDNKNIKDVLFSGEHAPLFRQYIYRKRS